MLGLVLLDKTENKTSYGAVACIKRITGEKRVGHTGTLDPMATGVLPVLLGRATALSSYLLDADKRYTAKIKLGIETDSCDITGNVINGNQVNITEKELIAVLSKFIGKIMQQPPMFSALKKDGIRLYKLARNGESVEIPEREIEIYSLNLISGLSADNEFEIDVHVSKGTYIRSLARDIGRAIGCGAVLTALRRTAASGFDIKDCVPLSCLSPDNINNFILSEEIAVKQFRAVEVTENQAVRFCNGGQLSLDRINIKELHDGEIVRVRCKGCFLGLGYADRKNYQLCIKCIIRNYETERQTCRQL